MKTRYYLELSFVVSNYGSHEDLEGHLDHVADSLVELHGVIDPDLGANLADGIVTFTMSVDAKTPHQALRVAMDVIRTAIHAADGCTAGWEGEFQDAQQVVRPSELIPT